jgi:hypothetical protein
MSKYIVQTRDFENWKDYKEPYEAVEDAIDKAKYMIDVEYQRPDRVRIVEVVTEFQPRYDVIKVKQDAE